MLGSSTFLDYCTRRFLDYYNLQKIYGNDTRAYFGEEFDLILRLPIKECIKEISLPMNTNPNFPKTMSVKTCFFWQTDKQVQYQKPDCAIILSKGFFCCNKYFNKYKLILPSCHPQMQTQANFIPQTIKSFWFALVQVKTCGSQC